MCCKTSGCYGIPAYGVPFSDWYGQVGASGWLQSKVHPIRRGLLHEALPCIAAAVLAIAPFVKCEVDGRGDVDGRFVRSRGVTYVEEILNILLPGESRGVGDPEWQKV